MEREDKEETALAPIQVHLKNHREFNALTPQLFPQRRTSINVEAPEENVPIGSIWRSCCFQCDSRSVMFFSRLSVSLLVLVFCIYRLCGSLDCTEQQVYVGVLNFIIGAWITPIYERSHNKS